MIERDPPYFFDVSCDTCSAGEERIESQEFTEVVKEIKDLGWRVRPDSDGWEHTCPDCVAIEKQEAACSEFDAI